MVSSPVSANTAAKRSAEPSPQQSLDDNQTSFLLTVVRLISLVPFSIRSAIGWCLGYVAGLLPLRERQLTLLQLKVFMPEVSAARITPRVFANAGRTLMESLSLKPMITKLDSRIQCDAWPTVQEWISDERPIITLTAHTGNWDLLAGYVIARGIPLTTIGREARNPSAQRVLRAIREGYGIETIWRSDRTGLKRLIQCLKERRVIAALIDQDTRVESIPVPFFGTPAKTPVSLITMGMKANARFVSAFLFRTGWLKYKVFIQEIPTGRTEQEILQVYHDHLEQLVRRYPDQWVWFHKRWRSLPDGTTLSSRQYRKMLSNRLKESQSR
jgi:KDO2-lipid IV(A) lauroyltransferase